MRRDPSGCSEENLSGCPRRCDRVAQSDNLIRMKTITATEAARNFAAVLDQAEHGETIIVTRGGRRVATIGPAAAAPGRAVKELLRRHRPDPAWAEELRALRRLTVERERAWPDA